MVSIHPEVVEVPLNATHQRRVLLGHRLVPVAPTPFVDGTYRPSQPRTPRLAAQTPSARPSSPPVQRKTQEVEGRRTFAPLLDPFRVLERDQASLVRMEAQPIPLHPLAQHGHHAFRILPLLETDDKIIGVTDQAGSPFQARLDFPLEPAVEDVVQIDVAQQAGSRVRHL